jgi:hypothetical protein
VYTCVLDSYDRLIVVVTTVHLEHGYIGGVAPLQSPTSNKLIV